MKKYYARIKEGLVKDIIVLEDETLVPLFGADFDFIVEVEKKPGAPCAGFSYDPESGFSDTREKPQE